MCPVKVPKHLNTGSCEKCIALFDRYPGFHSGLRAWFQIFQVHTPDAHISCAGRGEREQTDYFKAGSSRAKYGESAHNYNAAIDVFRLTLQGLSYDQAWFRTVLWDQVKFFNKADGEFKLRWYGAPGSKYFELPHVEVEEWHTLGLDLVETPQKLLD